MDTCRKDVKEENRQGWDPRTHEQKSSANSRQGCGLIVRAMGKDVSENPMRATKVDKLMLNDRVGESGDRSVRAEKVLQQAEKNEDSATQKEVARVGGKELEKISR